MKQKATKENSLAQLKYGIVLEEKGEIEEAKKWYLKAAKQEGKHAQFNLRLLYHKQGRIKDAEIWHRKSAEQSLVEAQNNLVGLLPINIIKTLLYLDWKIGV